MEKIKITQEDVNRTYDKYGFYIAKFAEHYEMAIETIRAGGEVNASMEERIEQMVVQNALISIQNETLQSVKGMFELDECVSLELVIEGGKSEG